MNLVPILSQSSLFKSIESNLRDSIISNDIKQVKKLLERDETIINRDISGGDILEDHLGYAPLHYVCEYNTQIKILEILLKKKAMINIRTNNEDDRSTPLHIAVKFSKMEIIKYLLTHQANPNETDSLGETVLMKAAFRGDVKLVALLLSCGSSINVKDFRGQTPLMIAMKGRQIPTIKLFLEKHRLLINEIDNVGNTALMRAVQQNYLDAVYFLLQHRNIDVNIKNENGETALMLAAAGGYSIIIEWLLEKEAFSSTTNVDDETALDILHKRKSINPLIKRQIHRLLAEAEVEQGSVDLSLMLEANVEEVNVSGRLTQIEDMKMREHSFATSSSYSSATTRSPSISAPTTPSIGKTDGMTSV